MLLARARLETVRTVELSPVRRAGRVNADLEQVVARRPFWSRAIIEQVFWSSVVAPRSPAAVAALAASYRSTPYLSSAALWRAEQASALWRFLPSNVRRQALDEISWYAAIDYPRREAMMARVAGSPIEVAVLLRKAAP